MFLLSVPSPDQFIARLGSVALAFGLGGRDVAGQLLSQAYSKGEENTDQVKQNIQVGKDRAQDQAQTVKSQAQDGTGHSCRDPR